MLTQLKWIDIIKKASLINKLALTLLSERGLDYLLRRVITASANWRNTFSVSSHPIQASVTLLP